MSQAYFGSIGHNEEKNCELRCGRFTDNACHTASKMLEYS